MARPTVTTTIIVLNEERTIAEAIKSVSWADEVIVVDSGSTDRTVEIAKGMGAKVFHQKWLGYGQQKNFAQNLATCDWVLNIDGDEIVSPELAAEIRDLLPELKGNSNVSGFSIPRKTFYMGRWIRYGGWYPNFLVRLARRNYAKWTEPHVHEALRVDGHVKSLRNHIHHFAFTGIEDQVLTNLRFAKLGSRDLGSLGKKPSVFRLIVKPLGKFVETYFLKRGFKDGLAGFIISINAAYSMFLKHAFLCESRIGTKCENSDHRQHH